MGKAFIFLSLVFAFAGAPAWAGWENGNAGDAFAEEFILTGRDIVQRLELLFKDQKPVVDTVALRGALEAPVITQEHVYVDGYERDAKNHYPVEKLIEVNRSRWRELRRPTETKARMRVVLHEYLWTSGTDDTNYVHSDYLMQLLNVQDYGTNIWWNPVNPVNLVRPALVVAPEGCTFLPAKLDLKSSDETLSLEPTGDCQDAYRKLVIVKTAGVTPVSSNVRGLFHTFDLSVFDRGGAKLGEFQFEPEWGACLLPESGTCQGSGKMTLGGVEIVFWFIRE